jgi:ComEC/Rec2-related protein
MRYQRESLFDQRPALKVLVLIVAGIVSSILISIPYYYPLMVLAIGFVGVLYLYARRRNDLASLSLSLMAVSLGWYLTSVSLGPFPVNHISNLAGSGKRVEVIGRLVDEPDIRPDKTYLTVETDSVKMDGKWIATLGKIRVRVKGTDPAVGHRDYLKITGYLYKPSGASNPIGFDYAAYLKAKQIYGEIHVSNAENVVVVRKSVSLLSSVITPFREYLISKSNAFLPGEKAAIFTGFILGEKRDMPESIQRLFRNTGTMHLMAVSGSNVAIIIMVLAFPLTLLRMPRSVKAILLLVATALFAILTRLEPSVVRASIMAAIGLVAYGWMRKPDLLNLLAFAGLVMLLWNPLQLLDIGFQLSYAAAFGIIFGLPLITRIVSKFDRAKLKLLRMPTAILCGTMAAQIAVWPLSAHYFHSAPALGSLANIPVIILVTPIFALGIIFFGLTLLSSWIPLLASTPMALILDVIVKILEWFSSLPLADARIGSPSWPVMILFWLTTYFLFEIAYYRRLSKIALVMILLAGNLLIWNWSIQPLYDWNLEFLDLRRDHAWIYSSSSGRTAACIDLFENNGESGETFITHVINRYGGKIDLLLTGTPESAQIQTIGKALSARPISLREASRLSDEIKNLSFDLEQSPIKSGGRPATIKVLWDESDNTNAGDISYPAIVIDVDRGVLIMAGWAGMGTYLKNCDEKDIRILELPWSQYARYDCRKAIRDCGPQFVVFSPDKFSSHFPEDRDRLTHSQDKVLATSFCGAIAFRGHAGSVEIETMRPIN